MFRYGKRNGYLTIALIALAIVPILIALFVIPQMPDEVPMAFGADGAPTRFASRYQLLLVRALADRYIQQKQRYDDCLERQARERLAGAAQEGAVQAMRAALLGIVSVVLARRQAEQEPASGAVAQIVYFRHVRSAVLTELLLFACTIYILVTAYLGTGFTLAF